MTMTRRRPAFTAALLTLAWATGACGDDGGGSRSGADALGRDATSPDTSGPPSLVVDLQCVDGQYAEALPPDDAPIAELVAAYSAQSYESFVQEVLSARYPIGAHLVERGVAEYRSQDCVALFSGGATGSAKALIGRLSTIVHECGHFLDGARGALRSNTYVIRPDLAITCAGGDARDRFGNTFARAELTGDAYDALWPDDFYKDTYLVGPGSEQGFNMLAEEAVQYINSLATDWALRDFISPGFSITARDGILTFLWYIERYLRLARLEDPEVHTFLLGDACWRELVLTIWGRAWQYLNETDDIPSLGIDDGALLELVLDPDLLGEIDRVREAHGCP